MATVRFYGSSPFDSLDEELADVEAERLAVVDLLGGLSIDGGERRPAARVRLREEPERGERGEQVRRGEREREAWLGFLLIHRGRGERRGGSVAGMAAWR